MEHNHNYYCCGTYVVFVVVMVVIIVLVVVAVVVRPCRKQNYIITYLRTYFTFFYFKILEGVKCGCLSTRFIVPANDASYTLL